MNVLELTQRKNLEPRRVASTNGGEYTCACPGCGGRDRFHIWPEEKSGEGAYWCRGCGKSGDAIQFCIDFNGMDFKSACEFLGKDLPKGSIKPFSRPAEKRSAAAVCDLKTPVSPPDLWMEKAGKFVEWSKNNLFSSRERLKWLRDERGIMPETAERYSLGWNPGTDRGDIYRPRESWGLPEELKDGRKKKLWLPVGLVIPLIDGDTVLRIRIRREANEAPRYYIVPGSCLRMFFKPGTNYLVMESELDFILVDQEAPGFVGLLALGSSMVKPDPDTDRALNGAGMILNALDFDDAGFKAGAWWEARYPQTKRWPVPSGKDPTDAWKAGVSLRDWISLAFPKGWTSGESTLNSLKSDGGGRADETTDDTLPASVRMLAGLLKDNPVALQVTPDRMRLLEPREWARKNWEISRQISQLVYFDDDVALFLRSHPAGMVTGKNFFMEDV